MLMDSAGVLWNHHTAVSCCPLMDRLNIDAAGNVCSFDMVATYREALDPTLQLLSD